MWVATARGDEPLVVTAINSEDHGWCRRTFAKYLEQVT